MVCAVNIPKRQDGVALFPLDLTTDEGTHMCTYDIGVKDICFKGNVAIFSENFLKQYAGGRRLHRQTGWVLSAVPSEALCLWGRRSPGFGL